MDKKEISDNIDRLISDLKKNLINAPFNQRTFFDKVKNWWQNITKKADNPSNPYYYQNKFGSLGAPSNQIPSNQIPGGKENEENEKDKEDNKEEFEIGYSRNESKLTLKEYLFLNENVEVLTNSISSVLIKENSNNIQNLEIFRIIDDWSVRFKKEIFKLLGVDSHAPPDTKIQTKDDNINDKDDVGFEFKDWIRDENNMQILINIVNRVYDSPQYSSPLSVVVNTLKNKRIVHSGKTDLKSAVRNKILSILQREIKQNKKSNSVFVKNVWNKHKSTLSKYEDRMTSDKDDTDEVPTNTSDDVDSNNPVGLTQNDFDGDGIWDF
jgi:hypothetical protein